MESALILPAFIAGLLTFLAPCTLPLVPGFLAFISGTTLEDLENPKTAEKVHTQVLVNAVFYVIGFSVIFILLGSLFGLAGASLAQYRGTITRLGGIFVVLFGLYLVGGTNIKALSFLNAEKKLHVSTVLKPGKPGSSLLFGATFAFGWTPCIGPILGSILLVASTTGTVLQGMWLLTIYAIGLAIPFLVVALGAGHAAQHIKAINKYLPAVSRIGGLFLILLGLLMAFDRLGVFYGLTYQWLSPFGYDVLLNYF